MKIKKFIYLFTLLNINIGIAKGNTKAKGAVIPTKKDIVKNNNTSTKKAQMSIYLNNTEQTKEEICQMATSYLITVHMLYNKKLIENLIKIIIDSYRSPNVTQEQIAEMQKQMEETFKENLDKTKEAMMQEATKEINQYIDNPLFIQIIFFIQLVEQNAILKGMFLKILDNYTSVMNNIMAVQALLLLALMKREGDVEKLKEDYQKKEQEIEEQMKIDLSMFTEQAIRYLEDEKNHRDYVMINGKKISVGEVVILMKNYSNNADMEKILLYIFRRFVYNYTSSI
jgi:hypothetical protein